MAVVLLQWSWLVVLHDLTEEAEVKALDVITASENRLDVEPSTIVTEDPTFDFPVLATNMEPLSVLDATDSLALLHNISQFLLTVLADLRFSNVHAFMNRCMAIATITIAMIDELLGVEEVIPFLPLAFHSRRILFSMLQ